MAMFLAFHAPSSALETSFSAPWASFSKKDMVVSSKMCRGERRDHDALCMAPLHSRGKMLTLISGSDETSNSFALRCCSWNVRRERRPPLSSPRVETKSPIPCWRQMRPDATQMDSMLGYSQERHPDYDVVLNHAKHWFMKVILHRILNDLISDTIRTR